MALAAATAKVASLKNSSAAPSTASKSGSSNNGPLSAGTLALALQASAIPTGGIRIQWLPLDLQPTAQIEIFRKAPDEANWTAPAVGEPSDDATSFDDTTAVTGVAYEYKVVVYTDLGAAPTEKFILAGNQAAAVSSRGTVLLVVDITQLDTTRDAAGTTLLPALQAYQADLISDGYKVRTIFAPRTDVPRTPPADLSPEGIAAYYAPWSSSVMTLKAQIRSVYQQTPDLSSVVLIGHVPVPYSGIVNPDGAGHLGANGAWPADVFYTTLSTPDSVWTDTQDGGGEAANQNFIGDGKFDQDTLAEVGYGTEYDSRVHADVAIGRIDFSQLSSFNGITGDVEAKATAAETKFLASYLAKDHAWRTGQWNVQRKALFEEQFPFAEYYDTNRLTPNVGLNNIIPGTVSPTEDFTLPQPQSDPNPQAYDLTTQSWLWLYAGAGGYPSRNVIHFNPKRELRTGHYANGQNATPGTYGASVDEGTHKAVFNFIYGSYVGDWDFQDSLLRAVIAEPDGMGLAVAWGARPNWDQHAMGLGETIGYSLVKTLNNFGDSEAYGFDTYESSTRLSLLGDPTLRQDNVVPPTNVTTAPALGAGTTLSWASSTDAAVAGYYIYRAASPNGPFTRLNASMITGTTFTDTTTPPTGEVYYLVRAAKLQSTPSGTYWNLSEGVSAAPRVTSAQFVAGPGAQTLQVKFDQDVGYTLTTASLRITGSQYNLAARTSFPVTLTAGVDFHLASYDSDTRTATIVFDTTSELSKHGVLPSGRYTLKFAANVVQNAFGVSVNTTYAFSFGYLVGDTNGDLRVDFNDLVILAQNFNHNTNINGNLSGDFNGDGVVNFDDLVLLAQRYNVAL